MFEKIIWDDAGGFGDDDKTWHTLENVKETHAAAQFYVTTYGVVIIETKDDIVVAQSVAHNDESHQEEYSGLLRIPKGMLSKRIKYEGKNGT